jgi:two-component system LytT family response regulator
MKRATAIIVDDERPARREMAYLLKAIPEIEVVGEAENIGGAIELIESVKPAVVFLDIQLAGENGFELLEKVSGDFKVIFVTAYDAYALRAFEVNAADYLLKPVEPARLELSVKRILGESDEPLSGDKRFRYSDLIYVSQTNRTSRFIRLDSVVAIQSVGNYSRLVTKDGNGYLVLKTIKQWEEELPEKHFIRIHRSAIINLQFISRIEKHSGNCHRIHMLNINDPLEVSRSCASKLKNLHRPR